MSNRPQSVVVVLAVTAVVLFAFYQYWLPKKPSVQSSSIVGSDGLWSCPMHPQLLRSEKGTCPSCGMPLVKVSSIANSTDKERPSSRQDPLTDPITLRPEEMARLAITTQRVEQRLLARELEVDGKIEPDESRLVTIPSRVAGRIEKMYVNVTGQAIAKGEPLYSIYSPSLVAGQEEYLLALSNRRKLQSSPYAEVQENALELVEASRRRLTLAGLTTEQVHQLEQAGNAQDQISFQARLAGTVIKRHVVEGTYVEKGDPIYTLADLSKLWMIARVPEHQISWITLGQRVSATTFSNPGEIFSGQVAFVDPVVDPETRTIRVRTEISNPHLKLKPEMFGRVKIRSTSSKPALTIPGSAVIDASPLPLVYVEKGNGVFVARQVRVGLVTPDYVAILDGLVEGERVVARGNFFIDSQRQLRRGASVLWGSSKEIEAKEPTRPTAP
jgi:membrane fusion protein, copper/silver efflux system